ncbi:Isoepoxydon dehydrogenase patN [Cladobotryum mycophilum]|uniref:Isoepoxydon dehydrogenase patN n=1 Tax=Cladobotryum mycophilum TaxID=491253 RepID=A0ABR0T0M5_9HYPO
MIRTDNKLGGSKGLGKGMVEAFLAEGANVSYCARKVRGDEFSQFTETLENARAVGSSVDIGNPDEIKTWVEKAAKEFGKIDCVVANACAFFSDATPEHWEKSFRTDIMGLISLIEAVTPHLEETAKGSRNASIVVISSMAGYEARHPSISGPYTTFKRAQATLAKDYARKLAPKGIRINTVVPGSVETPNVTLPDGTVQESSYQRVKRTNYPFYQGLLDAIPMGRTGMPEELANAVIFLSSHLSNFICGTSLVVDGAMSLYF